MGLIEMARVVMEIGVRDILLMARSPRGILAIILATSRSPLFEKWNLFPHSISVDLPAETQLNVEAVAIDMLLQYVPPHEADAAQLGALICIDVDGKVVGRVSDEAPTRFVTASNKEFVSRAAKM